MRKLRILLISILAVFLTAGTAMATPYSYVFGDDVIMWPGETSSALNADIRDAIGTPTISGFTVNVDIISDVIYLDSVVIDLIGRRIDTLFINTGGAGEWDDWDYIVNDSALDNSGEALYSVIDPTDYQYLYATFGRTGHASGIVLADLSGPIAGLIEVEGDDSSLTYSFVAQTIALEDNFTIGYTPNCANDVLLETATVNVPEPATMLLLGSGLLGLALIGRKKFIKRS